VIEEPTPPFFLDVNVPMYAAGVEHPYREPCRWVMAEIAGERLTAVIDAEIIQEILHRYGALGRYADAVAIAREVMEIIPSVLAITAGDVQTAVALFQQYAPQGLRARDVLHLAVMLNNGLTDIISTDGHFDLVPGIRRIDPGELYQQAQVQQLDEGQ
jgi:predicted nucleic acid-binding protein